MALAPESRRARPTDPPADAAERLGHGIAVVATYPPRACGTATFTRDLRAALKGVWPGPIPVAALHRANSTDPTEYPDEVFHRIVSGELRRLRSGDIGHTCVRRRVRASGRLHALRACNRATGPRRGRLVPFDDPEAMADAFSVLLLDPVSRQQIRRAAWEHGRGMIWPAVATAYGELFAEVLTSSPRSAR